MKVGEFAPRVQPYFRAHEGYLPRRINNFFNIQPLSFSSVVQIHKIKNNAEKLLTGVKYVLFSRGQMKINLLRVSN